MLDSVLLWLEKNRHTWLAQAKQFFAIPSVSAQSQHDDHTRAAAEWAHEYLRGVGLQSQLVPTAKHPCVLATTPAEFAPADAPHVLLYGHYDVQPPDPLDQWQTPPFTPTVRDDKIFCRGASDDKGQVFCHFAALAAWRDIARELPVRLTVLLEGEEEIGSPNLRDVMGRHAELLRTAQTLIISDSDQFAPGVPAITCGLRGLVYFQVNVRGANSDLHSGLYGGAVANPANALARILGQLHDANGRVTIPHFYDDVTPITAEERRAWAALPFDDNALMRELNVNALAGEAGFGTLERRWARPTLDINGLTSGYQDAGAKTVLPATASAKVSMRLVTNQNPDKIADAFEAFVRSLAPPGVVVTFDRFGASPPHPTCCGCWNSATAGSLPPHWPDPAPPRPAPPQQRNQCRRKAPAPRS